MSKIKVGDVVISHSPGPFFGDLGMVTDINTPATSHLPYKVWFGREWPYPNGDKSQYFSLSCDEAYLEVIDHIDPLLLYDYDNLYDTLYEELIRYSKKPDRTPELEDDWARPFPDEDLYNYDPDPVEFNGHVYWLEMGKDKPLGKEGLQLKRKCTCCNVVTVMVPPISLSPFYPEA